MLVIYGYNGLILTEVLEQWILFTMTAFVPKDFANKMNLLLYRILNEQTDM